MKVIDSIFLPLMQQRSLQSGIAHSSHPDTSTDCECSRRSTPAAQIDYQVVDEDLVNSQLEC